jgi:NTP pyrophosphatase (non-canonical NTP hydrolase)
MGYPTYGLTFERLREANVARCEDVFHPLKSWSLTDWACAMAGEAGEACNVVKKTHRGDYRADPKKAKSDLAAELADVVIYLDLLAARAGIDLGDAVIEKFNRVSHVRGSDVTL